MLVLRGTGLNFWHYFSFLRKFSLDDLRQFKVIYGVSGGAAAIWFYCLARQQHLKIDGSGYDRLLRSTMNRYKVIPRLGRFLKNEYSYFAEDNLRLIERMVSPEASRQILADSPLHNLVIVAQDEQQGRLLLLGGETHPTMLIGEIMSRMGTTSTGWGRRLCARTEYHGLLIADYEFASRGVKQEFREYLKSIHNGDSIYQVNIFRDGSEGNARYVRVCQDRLTRLGQIRDFALLYFDLANSRYQSAYAGQ